MSSDLFRTTVGSIPGYDASRSGKVETLVAAFPAAR
jgi:hypothetical protein